jgi:hypothetical protein
VLVLVLVRGVVLALLRVRTPPPAGRVGGFSVWFLLDQHSLAGGVAGAQPKTLSLAIRYSPVMK